MYQVSSSERRLSPVVDYLYSSGDLLRTLRTPYLKVTLFIGTAGCESPLILARADLCGTAGCESPRAWNELRFCISFANISELEWMALDVFQGRQVSWTRQHGSTSSI